MFGRLLKHQLKSTWKRFAILYGLVLGASLFLGVAIRTQSVIFTTIASAVMGSVVLGTVLTYIISIYQICGSSTYGKRGYLTFSIPISYHQLVLSKILTVFIYILLFTLTIILSVFEIIGVASIEIFKEIILDFSSVIALAFDYPLALAITSTNSLINSFISLIAIQFCFACANTGICKKNRTLMALLFLIVYDTAVSILSSLDPINCHLIITDTPTGVGFLNGWTCSIEEMMYLNSQIIFSFWDFFISIALAFGLYFGTIYILDKKLELE